MGWPWLRLERLARGFLGRAALLPFTFWTSTGHCQEVSSSSSAASGGAVVSLVRFVGLLHQIRHGDPRPVNLSLLSVVAAAAINHWYSRAINSASLVACSGLEPHGRSFACCRLHSRAAPVSGTDDLFPLAATQLSARSGF